MTEGPRDASAAPPRVIAAKYCVVRRIGAGGMGAVYEAVNQVTEGRVALKMLHPHAALTPMDTERFAREARIAAKLTHPNIVRVFDLGRAEDGAMFIVQEYLEGEPLSSVVGHGKRLAVGEAIALFLPILDALEFAHDLGVVHRDLKPANLFLSRDARGRVEPKVIDFGIAKFLWETSEEVRTRTGMVLGTPAYLAPEQLAGGAPLDHRADLWSAAVVLYVMLAGRGPFGVEDVERLLVKILREAPDDVRLHAKDVPADVAAVLRKALSRDRDGRYASARELADALRRCVGRRASGRSRTIGAALGGAAVLGALALLGSRAARPGQLAGRSTVAPEGTSRRPAGTLLPAPLHRSSDPPDAEAARLAAATAPAPPEDVPRAQDAPPGAAAHAWRRHEPPSSRGAGVAPELPVPPLPTPQTEQSPAYGSAVPSPPTSVPMGANGAPITPF